jgi:hypothetical protein
MKLSALAALVAAVALPVAAQTNTPRVDQRGQAKVEAKHDKAKADGKVSAKERAKLAKVQNKESRKISRKTHNKRTTAPAT